MKYTKEYIANLDEKTLDFVKNWLFDTYKNMICQKMLEKQKRFVNIASIKPMGF